MTRLLPDDAHLPDEPDATKFLLQLFGDLGRVGVMLMRGNDYGELDKRFPRWIGSTPYGGVIYIRLVTDETSPTCVMGVWAMPGDGGTGSAPQGSARSHQFLLWRESNTSDGEVFEAACAEMVRLAGTPL